MSIAEADPYGDGDQSLLESHNTAASGRAAALHDAWNSGMDFQTCVNELKRGQYEERTPLQVQFLDACLFRKAPQIVQALAGLEGSSKRELLEQRFSLMSTLGATHHPLYPTYYELTTR